MIDNIKAFIALWMPRVLIGAAVVVAVLLVVALIVHYNRYKKSLGGLKKQTRRRASGIIFGKTPWRLVCSPSDAEGSIAIYGGSGSGKTSAVLIPTLQAWSGTSLVVDISGDIEKHVEIPDKSVIAPEGENTALYDVLAAVDDADNYGEKFERLQQLSFALIPNRPTSDDTSAFYLEESRKMLQAALVAYYFAGLDFSPICKQILSVSAEFLLADIKASGNELAAALAAGFEGGNEKTLAATKQEVDKAIFLFATNEKISAIIRRGGVSPATLEKNSVFLNIPDAKLEVFSPLLRLFVAQSLNYLSTRENGADPPILLALDEFASFGKLDILPALRKLRKKNVRIMILTQSLADLELIYGRDETRAMMDNFTFKAVMKASEVNTQQYFSDLAGDKNVISETVTESYDPDSNTIRESYSQSEHREKLIQPEVFGKLEDDLILFHPAGVMMLRRNYYFKKWIF